MRIAGTTFVKVDRITQETECINRFRFVLTEDGKLLVFTGVVHIQAYVSNGEEVFEREHSLIS